MTPAQTGKNYDAIASWWQSQHAESRYGVAQLERAIGFSKKSGKSLDVGCGSSGRFMRVLAEAGFELSGMDVSSEMLVLAKKVVPHAAYFEGDIASVELPQMYDFISAWDSTFHLPIELQEPALKMMCEALNVGGVLIFTCGGTRDAETIYGEFRGQSFEYSSLGVDRFLELLRGFHCECLHMEYDQGVEEPHVYIIARRRQ